MILFNLDLMEYNVPSLAPRAGLEPATYRLTAGRSAIELPRNYLDYSIGGREEQEAPWSGK